MPDCSTCGAPISENSKFCNECGAKQEPAQTQISDSSNTPPVAQEYDPATHQSTNHPRSNMLVITITAVVLVLAIAIGISCYMHAQARLRIAKTQASKVLSKLEACESAVTVGVTLDSLSEKSGQARQAVLEFSRSEYSSLMPKFTASATRAAQDYIDSCSSWFEDNKRAEKAWSAAYDKWDIFSGNKAPEMDDYKDDSETQSLWAKASEDLAVARAAATAGN